MELVLPILCILLGLAAAEPPPPNYMFNNYDEGGEAAPFGGSDNLGSSEFGQETSGVGFSQSPFGGEGGFGGENEVQAQQGDDYGFDGGPSNSFEGGSGVSSYSPPSGDHDSYGPPAFGRGKKRGYSFPMFLPKMPKIRINLGRPPKMHHASPSHFAYPSYVKSGPQQSSSPFESSYSGSPYSGPGSFGGSEMSSFDTSPKGPGSSYEESPTSAYGAPSKGPHSSYEVPITYETPSKGYGQGPQSNQYGGRPSSHKDIPAYKPSNPYGSAPLGLKPSGYKNTPSSQYGSGPGSSPSGFKKPYSTAYKQQAPDFERPYGNPQGGHSSPALSSAGYIRGPSYTKYGPPMKGQSHSSQPIPMSSYGSEFGQGSSYDAPPKSYGPPANDYLDPVSNYNAPGKGPYQGGSGSNSYSEFDEQENRYKRRPPTHGRPPMSSPHSHSHSPKPPRGKGYPSPSSGAYKPASQSSYNSYDNHSNYGSSPEPEYNSPHSRRPSSYEDGHLWGY